MEAIRVAGRIDLAQQVHAALVAAGADARLATAAPMAVISTTGQDGTGVDVLANGFDLCPSVKKKAPERPVVMLTWDEPGSDVAARAAAAAARRSTGPDAHLPWPASAADILAACERARAAARVRRPRLTPRDLALIALSVPLLAIVAWAFADAFMAFARHEAPARRWSTLVLDLTQLGIFAAWGVGAWRRGIHPAQPRRSRGLAIFFFALAALHLARTIWHVRP